MTGKAYPSGMTPTISNGLLRRAITPPRKWSGWFILLAEVARREALVPEGVEQLRVIAEKHRCDLPSDADHLVPVVRVEDRVRVGAHVVEDREVVGREGAHAARASRLVERAAALEAAHGVRERRAPHVREVRVDVGCGGVRVELDISFDDERRYGHRTHQCRGHAFARKRFDIPRRIADHKQPLGRWLSRSRTSTPAVP